jgi:hypothetical protein
MTDYWPQIITAGSGLFGTIVGGLISWGVQHWAKKQERQEKRSSLAIAIAAEIDSYLDLMKARDHVGNASKMIAANEQGIQVLPKKWMTDEERKASSFPIFDANLSQLGILGPVLSDIATFHRRVAAVRATIINAMEGAYNDMAPADIAEIMKAELVMWENAVAIGRSTARRLRDEN